MIPSSSNPRPARKESLKPAQLTGYLAGAFGTAALLGAPQAEAAVTAVTFGFGSVLNTATGYSQQFLVNGVSGGTFGTMYAGGTNSNIRLGRDGSSEGSVYHTFNSGASYPQFQGLPTFFADTVTIDGSAGGGLSGNNGYIGRSFWFNSYNPAFNLTSNENNKNIGFRTSTGNFGWANVSWDATAEALTINGAFVESSPNTAITIDESLIAAVPEPSRTLLALAGLGGVALRRRRKQVA
jgi:hypothetical protein